MTRFLGFGLGVALGMVVVPARAEDIDAHCTTRPTITHLAESISSPTQQRA